MHLVSSPIKLAFVAFLLGCGLNAAEFVTIKLPEGQMRCEVKKMTKSEVTLRRNDGKTMNVPLAVLAPREVLECYKAVPESDKNAQFRFDMGAWFLKKGLKEAAKDELGQATKLDPKLTALAQPLLKSLDPVPDPVALKPPEPTPLEPEKAEEDSGSRGIKRNPDGTISVELQPGENLKDALARAQEDFSRNFKKRNVPPRSAKEMKEFLDQRLYDLNEKIGGKWRMIETKHFYSFSNLPEPKHRRISNEWLEALQNADGSQGIYPLLCTVLRHTEGDKLWNNKCPIYFFEDFGQFAKFGAQMDGNPGAGRSGGYFSADGREAHVCIPFMTSRLGEKAADRAARSTLYHEGTHAFLQLTGEDVPLSRWLHEGLAQFIEFWYDPKNNPDRGQRVAYLMREGRSGAVPGWSEMRERPQGGSDVVGYSWAWIKLEYLYRNFNHQCLPDMIRAIKSGKTEDEAMASAFKVPVDKLEAYFKVWVKQEAKTGMNFHKR